MNIGFLYLFKLFCFFKIYTQELLGHMEVLFLIFWDASLLYSTLNVPVNSVQGFSSLYTLTDICYLCSFWWQPSDQCEVISHCGFDRHFPDNSAVWHRFMSLFAICMSSLEKSLAYFLIRLFVFCCCWVVWVVYIFRILTTYLSYHL